MTSKDPFAFDSPEYTKYRPTYPKALFEYLASLAPARELAWDCGTGNGQAARDLASLFARVAATDVSPEQIQQARADDRISYRVAPADRSGLADASVDLVTVASALHWFDTAAFYAEVRRVARPRGVLACWTYFLQAISLEVDTVVGRLYRGVLGPYWLPATRHLEAEYRTLPFPFARIEPPAFRLTRRWDLHRFMDFLGTWSGALRYRRRTGADPLDTIRGDLEAAWGEPGLEREVIWPLHLLVGRVGSED